MKIAHNYYVYIVQCNDGFYYTGVANNIEKRIVERNEGIKIQTVSPIKAGQWFYSITSISKTYKMPSHGKSN